MGAYACSKPRFLGGDVDEGLAWLDRAAKASKGPGLMSKVVSARACSVARSDEEAFVALLEEATTADLSRWPESRLENELAASKARFYLRHRAQWFETDKELAHGD